MIKKMYKSTEEILQFLGHSEDMNFGASFNEILINELKDPFSSIQMCSEFMSLSRKIQVSIARKRLLLLLRGLTAIDQLIILNTEGVGFLSIFEEQSQIHFKYNATEKEIIERCQKDGKSKK